MLQTRSNLSNDSIMRFRSQFVFCGNSRCEDLDALAKEFLGFVDNSGYANMFACCEPAACYVRKAAEDFARYVDMPVFNEEIMVYAINLMMFDILLYRTNGLATFYRKSNLADLNLRICMLDFLEVVKERASIILTPRKFTQFIDSMDVAASEVYDFYIRAIAMLGYRM